MSPPCKRCKRAATEHFDCIQALHAVPTALAVTFVSLYGIGHRRR